MARITFFPLSSHWPPHHKYFPAMSSRKQESAPFICLAGFLAASVGFLLSVLATIFASLASCFLGKPIIEARDAAVIASTPSPPDSLPADSLPDKTATPSTPSTKRRGSPEKLLIDVKPNAEPEFGVKLSSSPLEVSPDATPTRHLVQFLTPSEEIPTISITPPPTRLSHQFDNSSRASSTEINTLSSAASVDSHAVPVPERRGRRLRFSKIVHLFSDKRAVNRRGSLPALSDESLSPALNLSPVPLSPAVFHPSPPPSSPRSKSNPRKSRPRSLILRTASCPILHHSRGHSRSLSTEQVPPMPPVPATPQSPSCKKPKAEKKEPAPRPRTHPYEAPYFIPPPDSADVEEPLVRRRPSRRLTAPLERPLSGLHASVVGPA
ncbi:hypothetical protein B0H19DRAFT_321774 [Mycena capillaripes]|nr:hypothetical protein B0H19DRAFT_321774 [Mycena capillaripes]